MTTWSATNHKISATMVLLALLVTMNATAIWLRDRFHKRRVS